MENGIRVLLQKIRCKSNSISLNGRSCSIPTDSSPPFFVSAFLVNPYCGNRGVIPACQQSRLNASMPKVIKVISRVS